MYPDLLGCRRYKVTPDTQGLLFKFFSMVPCLIQPRRLSEFVQIVARHIIKGAFKAADLSDGQVLKTVRNQDITVSVSGDSVSFTAADGTAVGTVTLADVMSCEGVIHIINAVLVPGDAGSGGADDFPVPDGGDDGSGGVPVPDGDDGSDDVPVPDGDDDFPLPDGDDDDDVVVVPTPLPDDGSPPIFDDGDDGDFVPSPTVRFNSTHTYTQYYLPDLIWGSYCRQ